MMRQDSNGRMMHMEAWSDLQDKVVMVTGASSGLGRDFCLDLAKAGCRILAAARRVDRLKSLCDEINNLAAASSVQPRAVAVELDVTAGGPTIQKCVQKAWDVFGRIDSLINNAGIRGDVKSSLDISEEEWRKTFETNLTGAWLVSKYVCNLIKSGGGGGGSVINISSIAGLNRGQLPGGTAYVASKTALNSMSTVMAMELGKHNIRVNSVSPGLFKSEITEKLLEKEWINNVIARLAPIRSLGTVDPALTSLIRYLIHDSSHYVTGNAFIVDAGSTLPGVPIFSSL